jgi:hypothetical protein
VPRAAEVILSIAAEGTGVELSRRLARLAFPPQARLTANGSRTSRRSDREIGHSGVWRVVKRLDLNRLPASHRYKGHTDRWKRYGKPLLGHRVQVDVKFIEPLPGTRKKHYQYTAIDDCTRIRILRIYPHNNQKTAIQFLDYVLEKLPFQVEVVQTDNGAEFQGALHWHLLDLASATSTSNPPHQGSTGRSNARTGSTPRSSTECSTAS